jgi:hypothetical protein
VSRRETFWVGERSLPIFLFYSLFLLLPKKKGVFKLRKVRKILLRGAFKKWSENEKTSRRIKGIFAHLKIPSVH